MHFALCRAVARCQGRRLLAVIARAPLPAAVVVGLVALAPIALARVGAALGKELAPALASSSVATAFVLGPCLAAAAAGGIIGLSLPARAGLGQQIAAGPFGDRAAVLAPLLLPITLAAVVVVPSLEALTISVARSFPGGLTAGIALGVAVTAALPVGAVAAEGVAFAVRSRRRLVGILACVAGLGVWVAVGDALGAAALGPFAPVGLALHGSASASVALVSAGFVALSMGAFWMELACRRPEPRPRRARHRRVHAAWRFPVSAAVVALVARRPDVRTASVAALGFGSAGALIAVVGGAPPPGPFLLATTTALMGSIVAALATFGVLAAGAWIWCGAPESLSATGARACCVGLAAAAIPVVLVAVAAAVTSGVDWRTGGVVLVLVVAGTAVATIAGCLVPWHGQGIGDQFGTVAAFLALALTTSLAVGLLVPRLSSLGLPDPGIAAMLCTALTLLGNATLVRRLRAGIR